MDLQQIKALIDLLAQSPLARARSHRGRGPRPARQGKRRGKRAMRLGRRTRSLVARRSARQQPARSEPCATATRRSKPQLPPVSRALVRAPMFGVVHLTPAPGEPPFVQPGDTVEEGQVLCTIEAMKMFNAIESELSGAVLEILVTPGERSRIRPAAVPDRLNDHVRTSTDCQPRRDRASHPARLPRTRPENRRRPFRGRSRCALCPSRRPGAVHRPCCAGAELPEPVRDPVRRRRERRAGDPSRLRLPVGERGFRRAGRGGRHDLHRPEPDSIRTMGDKVAAKRAMRAAGVPCVPGPDGGLPDDPAEHPARSPTRSAIR